MYSEQDLRYAAEFRAEIHREALAKVRTVYPDADSVIDRYPVDAYFQEIWDYPGKWYTTVGIPHGVGSRKSLIEAIVRDTLEHCRSMGTAYADNSFNRVIAEYPDTLCDYCILTAANRYAKAANLFPYRGADSHRTALQCAAKQLFDDGNEWSFDINRAKCKKISSNALYAPTNSDNWLNYRKAFLCPPYECAYTDSDFERVNAVLFPGGTDELEVFRWTTDWSEYFNESESHDALCLTVYDRSLDRFVVIMASMQ